nr:hypothetical protein [uncultured Schaedlerella sp.]
MKAKYSIIELIEMYKLGIDKEENMLKIIECMEPIINKYSKALGWKEYEDTQQELKLSVIEAVGKIKVYDNEGKGIKFLTNAVRNRFYEIYRRNKNLKNEENSEIELFEAIYNQDLKHYDDVEFKIDLEKLIKCNSLTQQKIAYFILYKGSTDTEIAEYLKVSRQYVNRCKKIIFKMLNEYSFNK